ncbi:Anthocyanidin 3-O-glucosyltransferase [Oopsacas minuta]|uniref:Anthocyanidin 3-O-glucosyltransferase n=1 Tax=Oopsacas minuta TaxID=111878 RepID=A0AAV7JUF2_9METZ|nr:Anthocyanidin 3-O-glucosyltransferase [Oopsacas minuta]
MACLPSHLSGQYGIIRELLHQNHSVTCILNRACHEKLREFQVNLVHNDGPVYETVIKRNLEGPFNMLNGLQTIIGGHTTLHQDVLDYFNVNKIDVILSSIITLSSVHIADKFNIPLMFSSYEVGIIVREKCPDCKYTGTVPLPFPYISLSNSLPSLLIEMLFERFMILGLYPALNSFDSQRRLLGLEEMYPKSIIHCAGRFPIVYQNYHPLVPPSLELPDGRWLVGYIPPGKASEELSDEYITFLREVPSQPVLYISFGTIVRLNTAQLSSLYQQVCDQNDYKVIFSLRIDQQLELVNILGLNNIEEMIAGLPKHLKLMKYAPQTALLKTEQVKIFLSHGGYSSVMESIVTTTPMVLFPLMGDQFYNSNVMEEIGCSIQFSDMTALYSKLLELDQNYQIYKDCVENAKQLMSEAGGAPKVVEILERLSSRGYDGMSFNSNIQDSPDVYSSLLLLLALPIIILSFLIWLCYCCCCRRGKKDDKIKDE